MLKGVISSAVFLAVCLLAAEGHSQVTELEASVVSFKKQLVLLVVHEGKVKHVYCDYVRGSRDLMPGYKVKFLFHAQTNAASVTYKPEKTPSKATEILIRKSVLVPMKKD